MVNVNQTKYRIFIVNLRILDVSFLEMIFRLEETVEKNRKK